MDHQKIPSCQLDHDPTHPITYMGNTKYGNRTQDCYLQGNRFTTKLIWLSLSITYIEGKKRTKLAWIRTKIDAMKRRYPTIR